MGYLRLKWRDSISQFRVSLAFTLQIKLQQGSIGSNELKVVHSGSEEYERAKLLKDLFEEFFNHRKGLQKRLDLDVGKIRLLYPN
jgi:hypothetical protein